jgi:hypothetical protein
MYRGNVNDAAWESFSPEVVNCACDDEAQIARAIASISASDWRRLEAAVKSLPDHAARQYLLNDRYQVTVSVNDPDGDIAKTNALFGLEKPVLGLLTVVQMAGLAYLRKLFLPDAPPIGWLLITILSVALAIVELEVLLRLIGKPSGLLDLRTTFGRVTIGVLGTVVLAVGLLFLFQLHQQQQPQENAQVDPIKQMMQDPNFKRGAQYMQSHRSKAPTTH